MLFEISYCGKRQRTGQCAAFSVFHLDQGGFHICIQECNQCKQINFALPSPATPRTERKGTMLSKQQQFAIPRHNPQNQSRFHCGRQFRRQMPGGHGCIIGVTSTMRQRCRRQRGISRQIPLGITDRWMQKILVLIMWSLKVLSKF